MNKLSFKLIVLITLMLLLFVPISAKADTSGSCGAKLTWTLDTQGTLTISGKGKMYDWSDCGPWGTEIKTVIIKSGVTSIGENAFSTCRDMTSIELPSGLTEIGSSAFLGCENLVSISFPKGVTQIGKYAFYGCTNLKSANLPEGLISLENWVFNDCRVLSNVQIPSTVTTIGDRAFYNCDGITQLIIPEGVTSIGKSAFVNCSSLRSVVCPKSLKSIGDYAFEICYLLNNVELNEGLTSIGESAFEECRELTSIVIPKTVTKVGDSAFSKCKSLSKLVISEGVTNIGEYAFNACSNLTSVSIPGSLTTLDEGVFRYCSKLSSVTLAQGVSRISRDAFAGCTSLTTIRLPDGVTTIGAGAFQECSNLKSIIIPESVTSIENLAFENCTSLSSFVFPSNLTTVGYYTFHNCNNLVSITIRGSSTYFDNKAFQGCSKLKQIYMPGNNRPVYSFPSQLTGFTLYCYEYTDIDFWAMEKGYKIEYLDNVQLDEPSEFSLITDTTQLFVGESIVIVPHILPTLNNPKISWASSNPQVASVNDGIVIAYAPGQTTITAVCGKASASVDITVYTVLSSFSTIPSELWLVSKTTAYVDIADILPTGAKYNFTASGYDSNVANVTLNDSRLTIKGLRPNDTVVIINDELTGISQTVPIHVCYPVESLHFTQDNYSLSLGESKTLTLVVSTQNQTLENHLATFSSSNPAVVTVDNQGKITAVGYGTAEVFAIADNSLSTSCNVSVSCDHIIQILPGIPATHVTTGLSGGSHCITCGLILSESTILPIVQVNKSYLPGTVITVDAEAFRNCSFECVIIGAGCKRIDAFAFADNSALLFVEIPASVTEIASSAFTGCSKNLVIVTPSGSFAESFALAQGITCVTQ